MHINARPNLYQEEYPNDDATPKAVIAAVASALAMRLSADDHRAAVRLLTEEWGILHRNAIIPQKPVAR